MIIVPFIMTESLARSSSDLNNMATKLVRLAADDGIAIVFNTHKGTVNSLKALIREAESILSAYNHLMSDIPEDEPEMPPIYVLVDQLRAPWVTQIASLPVAIVADYDLSEFLSYRQ